MHLKIRKNALSDVKKIMCVEHVFLYLPVMKKIFGQILKLWKKTTFFLGLTHISDHLGPYFDAVLAHIATYWPEG